MHQHNSGQHLKLLWSSPQTTAPVDMGEEHWTTEIPRYLGAPLLPPVERTRYSRPRRFDRLRNWIDNSPAVDRLYYGSIASTVAVGAVLVSTL
jgi:hypothetical protein